MCRRRDASHTKCESQLEWRPAEADERWAGERAACSAAGGVAGQSESSSLAYPDPSHSESDDQLDQLKCETYAVLEGLERQWSSSWVGRIFVREVLLEYCEGSKLVVSL